MDHLFLHFEFASKGWLNLFNTFGLAGCLPKKIDEWMLEGLDGGSFLWQRKNPMEMCDL